MTAAGPVDALLRPRGVAVVGASADPSKRGHQAVRALSESGYGGEVLPVNPRGGEILGRTVVPSVADLPDGVDLALVCTPAASAPAVVEALGERGVPAAVLLAVGFGESGADGRRLEAEVLDAARRGGVRLVGPNTSGVLNVPLGLNLIGARGVRPGGLGLLVQSGNLALSLVLAAGRHAGEGISVCVGVGNELDLGFPEFLDFLAADPATRAVLVHAEGFRRGPETLAAAARAARVKPVVLLKGARTAAAGEAARSHTGALTGPWPVLRTALRQAGILEVVRSDELFPLGETLARQPAAEPGSGVAVLSDGGGQGTLAVDLLEEAGVRRAAPAPGTRDALRDLLGPAAAVSNPVDLAGAADADPGFFARALELVAADPAVGAVLVVGLFGGYALRFDPALEEAETEAAARLAGVAREAGVGLVVHSMYAPDPTAPLARLREEGVPVVESLEVACRCVSALVERGAALARPAWEPMTGGAAEPGALAAPPSAPPTPLHEHRARSLLAARGVPLVPAALCADADAAVTAAASIAGPVALKAVADGLAHKTDVGAVALGVAGEEGVRAAFARVTDAASSVSPAVRGVLVSPMLPAPPVELLVGGRRDADVGPLVTVGAGGVEVEAMPDVAIRVLPVDAADVEAMLDELAMAPRLHGVRGAEGVDRAGVVEAVLALARLLQEDASVAEAEVNPLFAYPDRVVGVDARVYTWQETEGS